MSERATRRKRAVLDEGDRPPSSAGVYYRPLDDDRFIPSGCQLLDCVLGGGWIENRIANIVGDKSTGKTLLAIEACANFRRKHPGGRVIYMESEAAFDVGYAHGVGLPEDGLEMPRVYTVEDMYERIVGATRSTSGQPALVVVDSLDALSTGAELKRKFGDGTYGMEKPKQMGELFRRLVQVLEGSRVTTIIVSQERDKIGVMFGSKSTRSGGRALDFYASQILWLSQLKTLKRTRRGVERSYGIVVRAKCRKCKVGPPFRECDFPIRFFYGVDDLTAGVEWLGSVDALDRLGLTAVEARRFVRSVDKGDVPHDEVAKFRRRLARAVKAEWASLETEFMPRQAKYGPG